MLEVILVFIDNVIHINYLNIVPTNFSHLNDVNVVNISKTADYYCDPVS